MGPVPRLADVLGGEALAWLRARVRRRMEWGQPLTGSVSLSDPTEAQIAAAARLLGRPFRSVRTLRVELDQVGDVLHHAGLAVDIGSAVAALDGPVTDRADARRQLEAQWSDIFDTLRRALSDHATSDQAPVEDTTRPQTSARVGRGAEPPWTGTATVPESGPAEEWVDEWVARVQSSGLLRRLVHSDPHAGHKVAGELVTVMAALPAPQVFRSRFAAEVLGDAHALDRGPLTTLVRSAVKARFGMPVLPGAEGRIETWAAAGILVGDLTSTVLVAGFDGPPRVWTLRQLARAEVDLGVADNRTVWVVENPTVVAEALEALGQGCPPLVCASGQPTVAVLRLLRSLVPLARSVRYHGDFDWDGLRVANRLIQRLGVQPWRFRADDYRAAIDAGRGGVTLRRNREVEATWDPALGATMRSTGVAVEEEAVLDDLLTDLKADSAASAGDCQPSRGNYFE